MWQRRRWIVLGTAGVALAVVVVALALFQPWKLWVDDEVSQAAPAGAVPITAPATETVPYTVAPRTEAPSPSTSASSPTLPSPAASTAAPPAAAPPST
ncbi:MAG: hypothetical protein H0W46_03990, partial [Acidimicrobiia bacterium]|nr:hypothetical protein [Acidimicrobiia bacterium]